jgi:hypothetical protein
MRGTAIRLAALIVIVMAGASLAACGTERPPATRPMSATTTPASGAVLGPPGGNRTEALRLAREMISKAVLPPGAARYSGPLPPELRHAGSVAPLPQVAHIRMMWQVSASLDRTAAFIRARVPPGMRVTYQGHGSDARGLSIEEIQDVSPRSLPAGIHQADLTFEITPGAQGGTVILGDGQVIWYPPRSAAERVPAGMHAVTVTARVFNPRPHTISRTFTSESVIAKLALLLNGMHAAPLVPTFCPAEFASYRVAFAAARGQLPVLTASSGGCSSVTVTARGKQQPALWDPENRLRAEAIALLGVKPAP